MATGNFFDFHERIARGTRRSRSTVRAQAPAPAEPVPPPAAGVVPSTNGNGAPAGPEIPPDTLTVSQLTKRVQRVIKAGLPSVVHVRGEVSNYRVNANSQHAYFTLKDADACLECVMYKREAATLKFIPTDGLELLATGRVDIYGRKSTYQLCVTTLEPVGRGALELAFQQMLARLEAEGLFAPERKRPLPPYPLRIAIVTSVTTAAIQDVRKVFEPFPWLRLFVYNVPVQGDGAAERIARGVRAVNRGRSSLGGVDVILLIRGGGSLEDLWAFNEETLARALAASAVPVITGIGHETDTSIADLVADYWAHTPTEAAQVLTRNWRNAADTIDAAALRLRRGLRGTVQQARQRLQSAERHELFRRPMDRVNALRQLLDDRERALAFAMTRQLGAVQRRVQGLAVLLERWGPAAVLTRKRASLDRYQQLLTQTRARCLLRCNQRLAELTARLSGRHPRHRLTLGNERLDAAAARLTLAARHDLARRLGHVESLDKHLQAIGPAQVLRRGYSITVRKKDGRPLRAAGEVKPGDRLVTRLADGEIQSVAEDPRQPGLFDE